MPGSLDAWLVAKRSGVKAPPFESISVPRRQQTSPYAWHGVGISARMPLRVWRSCSRAKPLAAAIGAWLAVLSACRFGRAAEAEDGGATEAPAATPSAPATITGWGQNLTAPQGPLPTGATEQQKQVLEHGKDEVAIDYTTRRYEPAGFPIVGGDTDIGLQLGVAGSLTYFAKDTRPYAWNLNLALSASFKDDNGFRLVQQSYIVTFDMPKATTFFGHEVRFLPAAGFVRTINAPYYGRGNATTSEVPANVADPSAYYTFLSQMAYVRGITRIMIRKPFEIFVEPRLRYMAPEAYAGSLLASDAAANGANGRPIVRGLHDEGIVSVAAGVIIDSRDNELFPTRGVFDQFGVMVDQGIASSNNVAYGSVGAVVGGYLPVGPFVLAMRGVVDFDVGDVPFFDLYAGGSYRVLQLPGGATGVRGVPFGLYSGLIKAVGNLELRAMSQSFHVLRQRIRLGGDVFVDAGRAFDNYTFDSPRDGYGIGIHWGTGAGFYVAWGDAALLRLEVAYSPDAVALSTPVGGIPIGIYVGDGVMF